jgi:putative ABC transport system ATP-binding protein
VGAGAGIEVRALGHEYRRGAHRLVVLHELDLTVEPGGYWAITGRSGVGKSTLLAVLGGLEALQRGSVAVGGVDLRGLTRPELAAFRQSTVGFVFQHYGLLDTLSALENVELAGALTRAARGARRRRAHELLDAVGLGDRAEHRPGALSGGERQRVAIARALVNEPRLILADEPTGNLDDASAERVVELLERVHRELGCTLVVVTHSREVAARAEHHLALSGVPVR